MVKISFGNKNVDRISIGAFLFVLMAILPFSFLNKNAIYFFLAFFVIATVNVFRIHNKNHISFVDGMFIIEGVFGEKARLDKMLFEKLSSPSLIGRTPFSNELIIHFKNGLSFEFIGGPRNKGELEILIRHLIESSRA